MIVSRNITQCCVILSIHQLDRDRRSTITLLCFRLASYHNSALKNLERHSFWMDFIFSRSASDILGGTLEPSLDPHLRDIMNWHSLMFQLLSCSDEERQEIKKSETENLLRSVYQVPIAGELIAPQEVRTKESSVQGGTQSWMSVLLDEKMPVTSSTPTQLPLLHHLYSSKRKCNTFHSLWTFGKDEQILVFLINQLIN